ncbi:uncharacterized protein RCO7_03644 [Rhynchosporium graminicola]|uniref:Uncharacterized protein n=1 Tax=Rhynchosporium graminicola TaxID=2792576 RepID=A0A1E1LG33_9HELO|nr:uncharacterized protein RCO7_03644 [Rhynchosporium commune]
MPIFSPPRGATDNCDLSELETLIARPESLSGQKLALNFWRHSTQPN